MSEIIPIYCPVCREELKQSEDPFEVAMRKGLHPLEDYRIDCKNCGLYAWVEDVSVNKHDKTNDKINMNHMGFYNTEPK